MDIAEFEEKQYEGALVGELVAGLPTAYPSGQVLEALVGYDVALHPGNTKIWKLLAANFPPGILLTPGLWIDAPVAPPATDLPRDLVSLVLQTKRPQLLNHWRAGQDHYWRGPYFRFFLRSRQQQQLEALERNLGGQALVRYASAAFLTMVDLYDHQRNRTVADNSTFVAPGAITGHTLWSYATAGTTGYANPEGETVESDTLGTLLEGALAIATRGSLLDHLFALTEALDGGAQSTAWFELLTPVGRVEDEELRRGAEAWAAVAGAVTATGSEWLILDFTDIAE